MPNSVELNWNEYQNLLKKAEAMPALNNPAKDKYIRELEDTNRVNAQRIDSFQKNVRNLNLELADAQAKLTDAKKLSEEFDLVHVRRLVLELQQQICQK